MYEESVGETRRLLENELRKFDEVLDEQNDRKIRDYCKTFKEALDQIEMEKEY